MGPGGFAMGWMALWWLLILAGVIAVVLGLARMGRRDAGRDAGRDEHDGTARRISTARQILDERFARGEIDEEEYRARRRELDG